MEPGTTLYKEDISIERVKNTVLGKCNETQIYTYMMLIYPI